MKTMYSRNFAILLVVLLSLSALTILNVKQVKAQNSEIIYIKEEGNIEGTNKIQQTGSTYYFLEDIAGIIYVNKNNITIDGNNHKLQSESKTGIIISETENVTIKNMQIISCSYGIKLSSSSNNNIVRNTISSNTKDGIFLESSNNNNIENNKISNNGNGIVIGSISNRNSIIGNTIENNGFGIFLWDSSSNKIKNNKIISNRHGGVYLNPSSNNIISENNITNQVESIRLVSTSRFNNIIGNNFTNTDFCVYLGSAANNNIIYHNNFMATLLQVDCYSTFNIWDNGSLGNYWIDYDGLDTNGDGVGDSPYVIDDNRTDNYPLMAPYVTAEVTVPSFPSPSIEPTPQVTKESLLTPTNIIATISIITVAGLGIFAYFKKNKRNTKNE